MSATLTYPPGGTFFDTINKNFTDVTIQADKDNAIHTSEFLRAAESLTSLFGRRLLYRYIASLSNSTFRHRCPWFNGFLSSQE